MPKGKKKEKKESIPFKDNDWFIKKVKDAAIGENTKKSYLISLNDILTTTGVVYIHKLLRNPMTFGQKIANSDKDTSVKNLYFGIIMGYLKHSGYKDEYPRLYLAWRRVKKPIADQVKAKQLSNIPSKKQEEAYIDWGDVLEKRDKLPYASVKHVLLSLYTYVPPRRQLDYSMLKVYDNPKENPKMDHNHIHLYNEKRGCAYIFVKEYKTAKYYNDFYNNEIPKELVEIIRAFLKQYPREYLFLTREGNPYDKANSFQKFSNMMLKKIFDNDSVTLNALRHSYDTALNNGDMSYAEKQRLALKMGHSYNQSQQYAFILTKKSERKRKEKVDIGNREECFKRIGNEVLIIDCPS